MDKKSESINAEKVKRKVTDQLKEYGFKRTKPTFLTRILNDRIEFIYIHTYSFEWQFRVHVGIRFLCDDSDSIHLNGPDSYLYCCNRKVNMKYWLDETSVDMCADEIVEYIKEIGFAWFEKWRNADLLSALPDSPQEGHMLETYKKTMEINGILQIQQISLKLLGIKDNEE